jgi:23S rRNA (cytidine1920-2'-O)/16S rRNA (cytidine1409-2'-O)-methyltransferase
LSAAELGPAAAPPGGGRGRLAHALDAFAVLLDGRVAIDIGAATGGFTQVLLARRPTRVYAVDAGHGQLRGTLRQNPRVINLERTNLGHVDRAIVPEPVEIITIDPSYPSVACAAPQVKASRTSQTADPVALVKPVYGLRVGLAGPR